MRVLFICGREPFYTRNSVIIKGLEKCNINVVECTDFSKSYAFRYPKILVKYLSKRRNAFDAIFIGFFGQPLIQVLGRAMRNKPILFDAFISAYDTLCFDRNTFKPNSPFGKVFYWLDKSSCELADKVILDTKAHIDYFVDTFNLPKEKFHRVFVGADDEFFYPRNIKLVDEKFRVFYYGTYLPLHGIEYIIKAAKILEHDKDIEFTIVGKGIERNKINKIANKLKIKNIKFIDWIPYEKIPLEITKADICLGGHFSDISKAKRVIAGKTFQFIAMKKPIIIGNNSANRELFTDRKNALLVDMANAKGLADAILEMKENKGMRKRIANEGYITFKEKCTPNVIGKTLRKLFFKIL